LAIPIYPCLPLRRLSHRLGPAGQLWSFSSNFIQSCLPLIRLSLRLTPSRAICRARNRLSLGRDAIDDEFGNLLPRSLLYNHCHHITSRLPPQIQIAQRPCTWRFSGESSSSSPSLPTRSLLPASPPAHPHASIKSPSPGAPPWLSPPTVRPLVHPFREPTIAERRTSSQASSHLRPLPSNSSPPGEAPRVCLPIPHGHGCPPLRPKRSRAWPQRRRLPRAWLQLAHPLPPCPGAAGRAQPSLAQARPAQHAPRALAWRAGAVVV
jgi:hypothetical protein